MNDTFQSILALLGELGKDWLKPEYNYYYWLGYAQLNRN